MYLSKPVVSLYYPSGNQYTVSLEESSDTLRVFWEEGEHGGEEGEYQCFATMDFIESGEQKTLEEIAESAHKLIQAHNLESENVANKHFHKINYPN